MRDVMQPGLSRYPPDQCNTLTAITSPLNPGCGVQDWTEVANGTAGVTATKNTGSSLNLVLTQPYV
jgi:hypothetical protein